MVPWCSLVKTLTVWTKSLTIKVLKFKKRFIDQYIHSVTVKFSNNYTFTNNSFTPLILSLESVTFRTSRAIPWPDKCWWHGGTMISFWIISLIERIPHIWFSPAMEKQCVQLVQHLPSSPLHFQASAKSSQQVLVFTESPSLNFDDLLWTLFQWTPRDSVH